MQTLNPSETYTINRILRDHTDSTTYYVRAVVYDASTRATLSTINLTDNGNRWFSGSYKVPHDNIYRDGKRILIVTSVYTDSGYTTKSENHGDEPEEFLVEQRWNPTSYLGGNSEAKFDPEEIKRAMKEALKDLPKPIPYPPQQVIDVEGLVSKIVTVVSEVGRKVDSLPRFEKTEVDLSGLVKSLQALSGDLKSRPKFEKTDLAPVVKAINELSVAIQKMLTKHIEKVEQTIEKGMTVNLKSSLSVEKDSRQSFIEKLKARYS